MSLPFHINRREHLMSSGASANTHVTCVVLLLVWRCRHWIIQDRVLFLRVCVPRSVWDDRAQGHIADLLILIRDVCVHSILLVVWSSSVELVPVLLGLWNYANNSTANSYVTVGYNFTIREHSKVRRVNWGVISTSTEDHVCFSCHATWIPLGNLRWEDARLIHNRVFIEWIWIVVLSTRYVFRGNVLKDV